MIYNAIKILRTSGLLRLYNTAKYQNDMELYVCATPKNLYLLTWGLDVLAWLCCWRNLWEVLKYLHKSHNHLQIVPTLLCFLCMWFLRFAVCYDRTLSSFSWGIRGPQK